MLLVWFFFFPPSNYSSWARVRVSFHCCIILIYWHLVSRKTLVDVRKDLNYPQSSLLVNWIPKSILNYKQWKLWSFKLWSFFYNVLARANSFSKGQRFSHHNIIVLNIFYNTRYWIFSINVLTQLVLEKKTVSVLL